MAKKHNRIQSTPTKKERDSLKLSDALGDDILNKLKAAKKDLTALEQAKEKKRQEQLRREREEKEKNKSFEELLNEYGNLGSKY